VVLFTALGCAGGERVPSAPVPVATAIAFSVQDIRLVSLGAGAMVTATVLDQNGKPLNAAVAWSSSDTAIATVSDGLVTAIRNGNATVTARSGAAMRSLPVLVAQEAASLLLNRDTVRLAALRDTLRVMVTVRDAGGAAVSDAGVQWTSQDTAVATVTAGLVRAMGNGTARITAQVGALVQAAHVVVAQVATSLVVPGDGNRVLFEGDTLRLLASPRDANGWPVPTPAAIAWSSSDTSIARIDASGLLRAHRAGTTTVNAQISASLKAGVAVTVLESGPAVQFTYVSPSRQSNAQDQAAYEAVLDRLANEATFQWMAASDRQRWASELALYRSGQRSFRFWEPNDGSRYPGESEAAIAARATQVAGLAQRVKQFYDHHSGAVIRVAPLQVVRLPESAMHYVTPRIHSNTNVDQNPIVNEINNELVRRGLKGVRATSYQRDTIHVFIMDGGGGWAGAWQWDRFGGLAAVGDFSNCLSRPDAPALEPPGARARWPEHLSAVSWIRCNYNHALGTVIHELGHSFGLPHPADFECHGLSEALVMQSHWNADLASPGFFRPVPGIGSNLGIMKQWDATACRPTNTTRGYAAGFGTPSRPNARYRTELEILLDNPHFRR
jgi:uncharacterized protein YjdB